MAGPDDVVARLKAGNDRYRLGRAGHPRQTPERRDEVAEGQRPCAVVLGCADSRVPPEVVFDQGLGDLFTIRVAGNVVDPLVLASIEFAILELHPPVIVVLGHERCGAVAATVEATESGVAPPGHLGAIVERLGPVVTAVVGQPGDPVGNGVRANIAAVQRQLVDDSRVIAEAVERGDVRVMGACYDLHSGIAALSP